MCRPEVAGDLQVSGSINATLSRQLRDPALELGDCLSELLLADLMR